MAHADAKANQGSVDGFWEEGKLHLGRKGWLESV